MTMNPIENRKTGFYEKYIKRLLDIMCSVLVLVLFWWLFVIVAILVRIKLGSPVIFTQARPGRVDPKTRQETIFRMMKFRTMTNETDSEGNLLPDENRLTPFGKALRATSLDEIPEIFNILNGTMSLIGPRPQLVKDMVFMSDEHRRRHTARPGLSGLAQVNGRNAIRWEDRLDWDLKYIEDVRLSSDIEIVFRTAKKVLIKKDGITEEGSATSTDYGDYLLQIGKVTKAEYDRKQELAKELIKKVI